MGYGCTARAAANARAHQARSSPSISATVRVRNGDLVIADGPFAETKEQIAGFYIVECADLDEAIVGAARIPAARSGPIEV